MDPWVAVFLSTWGGAYAQGVLRRSDTCRQIRLENHACRRRAACQLKDMVLVVTLTADASILQT